MRKLAAFLLLGLGIYTTAHADETPHLDFIKQLRAKQYGDLALRYLDLLEKEGPPEVAAFVPIERASIYMDQAQQSTNPGERTRLYNKARAGFDTFIQNSKAKSPALAAIAQFESSRILAMQARTRLAYTRTLRDAVLEAEMRSILRMFEDANIQLERAGKDLDDQIAAKKAPNKLADALARGRLQCDLELARNLLDQAMTYDALNKGLVERGNKVEAALRQFKDLKGRDPHGAQGLEARAWEIRCSLEMGLVTEAKKIYDLAMTDKKESKGETGRRLAQFFYLQLLTSPNNVDAVKKELKLKTEEDYQKAVQQAARDWLRQYPSHANSAEGSTVRFELAKSLRLQGEAFPKIGPNKDQPDARAKPFLEEALQIYKDLDEVDTEYSEEVKAYAWRIRYVDLVDAGSPYNPGDAKKIASFQVAVNLAEQQGTKIGQDEIAIYKLETKKGRTPADDAKLAELKKTFPERRRQHLADAREILLRALELLQQGKGNKPKKKDILEAHATLAYILIANGDLHRAVVVGEHAAHTPATDPAEVKHAAQAASWAVQAYVQLISKAAKEGFDKTIVESDRERLRRLVELMDGTWKDDKSTDRARYQLGTLLLAEKKYKDAELWLSRVSDRVDTADFIDARYRWSLACQELVKEAKTDAEKQRYQERSIKALRSVPDLTGKVAPAVAWSYVNCKRMLGSILYQSKEFVELERMATALKALIPTLKMDEADKTVLLRESDNLLSWARFGRANDELAKGNYAAALKMVEESMKGVAKDLSALRAEEKAIRKPYQAELDKADMLAQNNQELPPELKQRLEKYSNEVAPTQQEIASQADLYRRLLMVALRACVQDGNRAKARVLLDQLLDEAQRDKAGMGILAVLVRQFEDQIKALKARSDAKSKAQLDTLLSNFINFLDAMAKQPKLDVRMVFFLATSYSSIGDFKDRSLHADAAKLLEQIKEPKPEPGVPLDKKAETAYRQSRLMMVEELRMAKKFKEANDVLKKVLDQPWGRDFKVKKQKPLLLMDQGFYGGAAAAWNKLIQELQGRVNGGDARIKENYYESYYQFNYCLFMYAKTANDPKTKAKAGDYIKRAANNIIKLEETPPGDMGGESFKKRYQDLLANEPLLKKEYDAIKKEKAAAAK